MLQYGPAVQVEAYLEAFADAFDLHQYIRYQTRVVSLRPLGAPSANGHAISNGSSVDPTVQTGSAHPSANGSGGAYSDAEVAPPRWRISTEPADKHVSCVPYCHCHDH